MNFSYNWLCELVEGLTTPPQELEQLITMKTAECEGVHAYGEPGSSMADHIIEIENKSVTHRPDLWGHLGLAREVAASLRLPLRDPVNLELIPPANPAVGVSILDLDLCPRYSALVFDNVTVGPSPPWLQHRLEAIGLNPINNIVDVTNYVMAELAQPMHAFDQDLLDGDVIFIRRAREGEMVVALNEQTCRLDPTNLVIADARGAIALAGVIGGLDSAISPRTRRIVLESASFLGSSVRRTSAKLKLRTDASMRFEKSQDPANTVRGLARAVEMFRQVSPGIQVVGGLADQKKEMPPPAPIELRLDWLTRKLGRALAPAEVREILERLCFGVEETAPGAFSVTVPSWRATRDISIKDDLLEEVGRMIGYGTIVPQPPLMAVVEPPASPERMFHRQVRLVFTQQGFTEVYNYSFLSEERARALGFDPAAHLAVANPLSLEQALMRLSLLPGIYRNLLENSKHFESFRLFEIGREIHPRPQGLPREVPHLMAALYACDGASGLAELKRAAECLLPGAEARPAEARTYEHPARAGELLWRGQVVGRIFELHPSLLNGRAALLDLDLDLILRLGEPEKRYRPIRRHPASAFDLSIVAGERELVGDLQRHTVRLAGEPLVDIEFLRQYSGPPIPEGRKSVSFRLTVAAADHTLSLEEAGAIRARIIEGLRGLGFDLRL
ncbi:MAG: phenylalanine--tRNA ligase subunit beta [Acidobacteria bacterium]|nr:phenylalanine--tRNA ligase subunit beta [Acidobacteriota bacterium]